MKSASPARRRPKITATVSPHLLAAVDAHVAAHPGTDRSAVIDDALGLWREREIERALEDQFTRPDGVDPAEREAWDTVRRAANEQRLPGQR